MMDFAVVIGPLSAALGASVVVERIIAFAKNFLEPLIGMHGTREAPKLSETDKKLDDLKYMYELNDISRAIDSDPKALEKRQAKIESQSNAETDPEKKKILQAKLQNLENNAQERTKRQVEIESQMKAENDPAKKKILENKLQDLKNIAQERTKRLEEIESQVKAENDPVKKRILEKKLQELEAIGEWDEIFPLSKMLVEPATDPDDGTTMRAFIIQLLGFAAGILLARIAGIQLFHAFLGLPPDKGMIDAEFKAWLDYVFTGLLIGGGSAPIHLLISFISERKVPEEAGEPVSEEKKGAKAAMEAKEKPAVPAVITAPSDETAAEWVDIPYYGGVDRDLLEDIHKRPKDPDMIVFHHTAMSSQSTFEDVVRVIKNRSDSKGNQWLTGYNCVVLADGSVHAFCRWDRFGSHAVGYNQRSLGIAFNGNFETDPKVPFSNPDGRYGPTQPTEEQLKAGARVVTLWTFLYPEFDKPDFQKKIVPHRDISEKACPGSMFPYNDFKKWVEYYRKSWGKSPLIQQRIAAFKQKPYLFVKEG